MISYGEKQLGMLNLKYYKDYEIQRYQISFIYSPRRFTIRLLYFIFWATPTKAAGKQQGRIQIMIFFFSYI